MVNKERKNLQQVIQVDLLRAVTALLFLSYAAQNFLVRTTEDLRSWIIVLPVWVTLAILVLASLRNKYIFGGGAIWLVLMIIYTSSALLNGMPLTALPFFLANGVLFLSLLQAMIGGGRSHLAAFMCRAESGIAIVVVVVTLYWINAIRIAQDSVPFASYELRANNYLLLADLLVVFSILKMERDRFWRNFLWFLLSIVALILLGSRSTLVIGGVALVLRLLALSRRRRVIRITVACMLVLSGIPFFLSQFSSDQFYRVASLFDLAADPSAIARQAILLGWLEKISNFPHCLVVPCLPEQGYYVHNFLSMLEYFGIAGSLVLVISTVALLSAVLCGWSIPISPLMLLAVGQIVAARAFGSIYYPILFAYVLLAIRWLVAAQRGSREFSTVN